MLKNVLLLGCLALGNPLYAQQDLVGQWQGALKGGSHELPVTFTIAQESGGWKATMSSGDDPTNSTGVTTVTLDGSNLKLAVLSVGGAFEGKISTDGKFAVGIWKRYGHEMPLVIRRRS